jgi:hydrogenase maturation protease
MTAGSPVARRIVVVGLGSRDRGDDALGPVVVERLAGTGLEGVRVLEHADPTDLVLDWHEHDRVIVVDAVVSGAPPGTVIEVELAEPPATVRSHAARLGLGGSHAFGLDEAVRLSRVLGRLPHRLTLVGVEAGCVTAGAPLSAEVAGAVPAVVARIRRLLAPAVRELADVPR